MSGERRIVAAKLLVITGFLTGIMPRILFGLILCSFAASATAQPDAAKKWRGVKVMPKVDCKIKVGDKLTDQTGFAIPYVVQDVNGELLMIGESQKGWVRRTDVLTLEEAPDYYTQLIKSDKSNAWAYLHRATVRTEKGELDLALADYAEKLRLQPDALTYNNRGIVWMQQGATDKAIADFDQAIKLNPKFVGALSNRGNQWYFKGDYDKAIADYSQALRLDPTDAATFSNRGAAWLEKKDYEKVLADFNQAVRLDPTSAGSHNNIAWLLATCPDERYRAGRKALGHATVACELSGWRKPNHICTLAAAYAESGDYAKATQYQQQALEMNAQNAEFVKEETARLKLYQDKKPYREPR